MDGRLDTNLSLVILNLSELNTPIKIQFSSYIFRICAAYKRHILNISLQKNWRRKNAKRYTM